MGQQVIREDMSGIKVERVTGMIGAVLGIKGHRVKYCRHVIGPELILIFPYKLLLQLNNLCNESIYSISFCSFEKNTLHNNSWNK